MIPDGPEELKTNMGGLLIKKFGLEPKRLPKEEFETLLKEMLFILTTELPPFINFRPLRYFKNKPDFGDCDIVLTRNPHFKPAEFIESKFGVKPHHNAGVYSFPYKEFQFDFITVLPEEYETHITYYADNDLGNLIGRGFHSAKMHYGGEGLYYWIREEDVGGEHSENSQIVNFFCLSRNPREIMEFGGYDYDRWVKGFDKIEDIFDFACRGRWFQPDKFKYENLNHTNRTRNKKRKTYQLFLEWLEVNKNNYKWADLHEDKFAYVPLIEQKFPSLTRQFKIETELYKERIELKKKFNGDLVIEKLNISDGVLLGKIIKGFKNQFFDDGDWNNYLKTYSKENIMADVNFWYIQNLNNL